MKTLLSYLVLLLFTFASQRAGAQREEDEAGFPLGPIGGIAWQTTNSPLLRVWEVTSGGPGALAGLKAGDFIYGANGERLPAMGAVHTDGWRGAVNELGYAVERSEAAGGALTLQVLRPGTGNVTLNLTLPPKTAWRPSLPSGDPRMSAFADKVCDDLHAMITASADGDFGYETGFLGMILLGHPNWSSTSGPRPFRNSINKLRDHCVAHLNGPLLAPAESMLDCDPLGIGLENWKIMTSAMFIGEYRRKTGDTGVNAAVQRAAVMIANRIQNYPQNDNAGVLHQKLGRMGHCGVVGDYPHAGLSTLNIMNAHAKVALGILKGAGANFNAQSGTSGMTLDQKFLLSWAWLKSCTNISGGSVDGNIGYGEIQTDDYDSAARTSGSAAGYEIYRAAGGTAATADDLDKLGRMKAWLPRNWPRHQHAHAYTTGGTAFTQMLLPFLSVREQRYFHENSRFLHTLTRNHSGEVLYFPGRALSTGDNADRDRFIRAGLAWAIGTGGLPSFPAATPARLYVRMNSPRNDWPQLEARRVKVLGLMQNLDLDVTDYQGNVVPSGIGVIWSKVSGAGVTFSSTSTLDTTVTFAAAGSYRLRLQASNGIYPVEELYDFEVVTSNPPVDTSAAITMHPVSRSATPGGSVTFSVAVSGAGPFAYQWKRNGVNFGEPQVAPALTLTNLSVNTAGAFRCSIAHPGGTLESREAVLSFPGIWSFVPGGLKREVWNNLSGALPITTLTDHPRFPACPDSTGTVTSAESPRDVGDNYGQRLSGWLVAPATGAYTFFLSSDDSSQLWLSTNDGAGNKVKIVERTAATGYRAYSGGASGSITLTAGQRYYMEILHVEGSGGDHVSVAWRKPGDAVPAGGSAPIPGGALEYGSFTPDPVTDGLVSHWKLDEPAGTLAVDSTVTGNDGLVIDAAPAAGRSGGGRRFDGTDQIQCGNAGALCGLQPFTVAAWIRVNNGNSTDGVIIQQRASNGFNGQYMLNVNGAGRLRFWCFGDSATQFDFTGSTSVNDGQWHHVAAARNATGGAFLYVDGVLDASVSGTTVRNLDGGINIGIGADIRDNSNFFRGTIDEVRIYNRAFGVTDAAAVVNAAVVQPATRYTNSFTGLPHGTISFNDGSVLTTDTPGAARVNGGGANSDYLIMTAAETLFTRTQYVLPPLRPATHGFSASFRYAIFKPASGPWADGFSFYLKPASEPVDTASNQVGGYAKGLGVEFITFSNPRHQIRVNNTVLPSTYAVSPNVDALWVNVRIEYTKPPGLPGRLTLYQNNVAVLSDIAVDYTPGISDVFAFTARTGGYAQTTVIDDIVVEPVNFLATETVGVEHFSYADGGIAGKNGGTYWDFLNFLPAGHAGAPSAWQNVTGTPVVAGGKLMTANNWAKRSFNGSTEADGAVNDPANAPSSREKKVYFRATVTTGAVLPDFFGLSSYDFGTERLFFGKRSNQPAFGLGNISTNTDSGLLVQPNTTYVLVGRVDFAGNNIALWVNPSLNGEEPAPLVSQPYTGTNWSTAVRLASGSGSPVLWDDLVVATTWSDLGIVVTTTTDEDNGLAGGGAGISLREAVRYSRPGALVTFAPALSGQTITLSSVLGQIVIPQAVTIDASGLPGGLTVDAQSTNRHFLMTTGKFLTLRGLKLTRGLSPGGPGGAVLSQGTLRLEDCTLSQNASGTGFGGGAVYSTGALSATRCSFVDNTAGSNGGGFNIAGGSAELSRCTIAGNFAPNGGALWQQGASTTLLSHCTIAGNRSTGTTGNRRAIAVLDGTLTLLHCTVSQNSGTSAGGGLFLQSPGAVNLQHSIIAGNTDPAGNSPDIFYNGGNINAGGSNLIGINTSVAASFPAGMLAGTAAAPLAPGLAPLGDYGGLTHTMALRPLSPARNAATTSTSTTDQRGFVIVGLPDIGAYEAGNGLLTNYNANIWETLPSTATAPQTATTFDFDSDGTTNELEWLAQTDPGNPGSAFRPSLSTSGGNFVLTFPTVPGRTYQVERSDSLASGSWVTSGLPAAITGDGSVRTFTAPAFSTGASRRFFRIQISQ